jgi:hypothetical protein
VPEKLQAVLADDFQDAELVFNLISCDLGITPQGSPISSHDTRLPYQCSGSQYGGKGDRLSAVHQKSLGWPSLKPLNDSVLAQPEHNKANATNDNPIIFPKLLRITFPS